jgi:phosphocarrier protein
MVTVANHGGVHLRAAMLVAKTVHRFRAKVELVKDRQRVDGTDVLQIVSLAAEKGQQIQLEAIGPDADAALEAVARLFTEKFDENPEPKKQSQ